MLIQLQKLGLKAKLFGDSTRLSILESLSNGVKSSPQIVREVKNQSNVSNHLCCLFNYGLLKNRRQGKNILYSLGSDKISKLLEESVAILSEIAYNSFTCVKYKEDISDRKWLR